MDDFYGTICQVITLFVFVVCMVQLMRRKLLSAYVMIEEMDGPTIDTATDEEWFTNSIAVLVCAPLIIALLLAINDTCVLTKRPDRTGPAVTGVLLEENGGVCKTLMSPCGWLMLPRRYMCYFVHWLELRQDNPAFPPSGEYPSLCCTARWWPSPTPTYECHGGTTTHLVTSGRFFSPRRDVLSRQERARHARARPGDAQRCRRGCDC